MKKQVYFVLGFHSHQPVGNFDSVFEDSFQKAYWPFLEILDRHPNIRVALHYTGILYRWLNEHHPELNEKLRGMVERNQIEMMTGGFYEPILSVIPESDRKAQILKLTKYVKEQSGYDAIGSWLAERVWEPQLASYFANAGVKYTVTDDSHFRSAGLQEEETWGYYLTEDSGKTLSIFPISERMRYLIPFQKPEKTIEFFKEVAEKQENALIVMADDLEKFGVWPGTYQHCYTDGWIEEFFTLLEENSDWIKLITFKDSMALLKPKGRIYLPTASYAEMMEWAMPTKAILKYEELLHYLRDADMYESNKPFVRGGFWRNFLVKYPESNNIHKKMVYVSHKVNHLVHSKKGKSLPEDIQNNALDHLYAGQTNCGYWHGIFGGLYLNYLRFALYRNLIQAETIVDQARHGTDAFLEVDKIDFDCDGEEEILFSTRSTNAYFRPAKGGVLFELDIKSKQFNLLDTLSRKPEAYHEKLKHGKVVIGELPKNEDGAISIHDLVVAKEPGLEKHLNYDWYSRYSFIDHIIAENTELESFAKASYNEAGDFVNQPYTAEVKKHKNQVELILERQGWTWHNDIHEPVTIRKKITIDDTSEKIIADYTIKNTSEHLLKLNFGVEFNYALLAGNADDRYYYIPGIILPEPKLNSKGENTNVTEMGLKDHWLGVDCHLQFSEPATLWRFPIETVSLSEAGFEKVYQSSVVFPRWILELAPGEERPLQIVQEIRHL